MSAVPIQSRKALVRRGHEVQQGLEASADASQTSFLLQDQQMVQERENLEECLHADHEGPEASADASWVPQRRASAGGSP